MNLQIAYKNEPWSPATGKETWLLFSVWDMSWGYRNTCFSNVSVVHFLSMNCNQCYQNFENSSTQNTRVIG